MNKVCTKCKVEKSLDEFYKEKRGKYGCRAMCKICDANRKSIWHTKNIEKNHNKNHLWFQCNKSKRNAYERNMRYTNINYKIKKILRNRLHDALKNSYKCGSAVRDLGCSINELKQYLEKMFYNNPRTGESMSWENYGFYGWHIDHIVPLSSFNLTDREQFLKAVHYTNLQPLWMKENLSKGDKII